MVKFMEGGVTSPTGFEAAGVAAGIKKADSDKKDMAMIYSKMPCTAAAAFTSNIVKAAPVRWDMDIVGSGGCVRAVVANSGIANACTGDEGMAYCVGMAKMAADVLGISSDEVLVASTGVIGKQLPMDRIADGIERLARSLSHERSAGSLAAEAIMTTDTVSKQISAEVTIGGKKVTIGGMCKGSGMIHPNMCTLLSFITTDAAISKEMLTKAVKEDVKDTYNMISVDGDTSTNDTFIVLANGMAGNEMIDGEGGDYELFAEALNKVNTYLAKKMAGDGEGATALLEVKVINALTKEQAVTLSKSVICSNLTKAAIYGHDANWGRILCAMGYSGALFDPGKVDIYFESTAGKIMIVQDGMAADYSEELASEILSEPEVTVTADIKMGDQKAVAWGCDLTYEYVKINADYRS